MFPPAPEAQRVEFIVLFCTQCTSVTNLCKVSLPFIILFIPHYHSHSIANVFIACPRT